VDAKTKKTIGSIAGGCGCFLTLVLTGWLGFVAYIGVQGRGNDEEASAIIGGITCCVMLPVLVITIAGLIFAFKKVPPEAGG
jgi:hypothetical protein